MKYTRKSEELVRHPGPHAMLLVESNLPKSGICLCNLFLLLILLREFSRFTFSSWQVDYPEGIFLSKDSRQVWMRGNQLAKPFPLLSNLLPAKWSTRKHKVQPGFDVS